MKKTYALNQSPLYKLTRRARLAEILKISKKKLESLSHSANSKYSEWDEHQANGKIRHIENPKPELKRCQARIAKLLATIQTPDFLMCPVKGRSYASNAATHLGSDSVLNLDIASYFSSTTSRRVFWFFRNVMKCNPDVAGTLTALSTFNGHLPTGSPLSPILSFYAHYDLWMDIYQACLKAGRKFTLYMDDLTISGKSVPRWLIWEIKKKIHSVGLESKASKERLTRNGNGIVTGVHVTRDGLKAPSASHHRLHKLRDKYRNETDPEQKLELRRKIRGIEAQHRQISRAQVVAVSEH